MYLGTLLLHYIDIMKTLTSGISWNTAELDNDPVAKPKRSLMTVFFRF